MDSGEALSGAAFSGPSGTWAAPSTGETNMGANDITEAERTDRTGTTDQDIEARLSAVLGIQTKNVGRLNDIVVVSLNPGPPNGPVICDQIIQAATDAITAAQAVKRKFSGT